MRRSLLVAAALALMPVAPAALLGCPGSLEDPGRFAGQFGTDGGSSACDNVPVFLQTTCATTSCHTSTTPAGMLDLASPDIASRLTGKKAAGSMGLLIDASQPDDSVLYTKLMDPPPFGSRM